MVPRAKIGYKTKYPRIRSDQKPYFLKNEDIDKKLSYFEFWYIWLKIVVPGATIVLRLLYKVP